MGADLYITSLKPADRPWDSKTGYFRDSYNKYDLLWEFGMSWWNDVSKTHEDGIMNPKQAFDFLKLLESKEKIFHTNMELLLIFENPVWDYELKNLNDTEKEYKPYPMKLAERKKLVKYYYDQYEEFKKFLNTAIDAQSNIELSL